jgi:ABC-type antimicrobial peptide transport system permease subunit
MYVPMDQAPFWVNRFVARVNGDPTNFVAPFSDAIETIDPDMPLVEPMSLHAAIYNDKKVLDVFGILFAAFGVGALLLTITGLYGVISFSVSSRTREFGIRLAMGARRIDLIRMVLQQGGRQLALGFAIGGTLAFALGKAAASTVDFITGVDPRAFGVVIVTLALTGLLALYSPARRAAGVQPLEALRHE